MSSHEIAVRVLDLAKSALKGAEIEVNVDRSESALTRFANSFIHQNVAEDITTVSLRAHVDGRTVSLTSTVTHADGLSALVERAAAAARVAPKDPGWPGLAPVAELTAHAAEDEATRHATPDERADRVHSFVEATGGLETAGYCRTGYWSGAFVNSAGQSLRASATNADMDGIARLSGADGVARRSSARLSDLDGHALGSRAARKVRAQADPIELPPGRYQVVLESEAVADLLTNFSFYGFEGKQSAEGRSFVKLGEQQLDPAITLDDDPFHPDAPGQPYDREGTPRHRLKLVDRGVTRAVSHDRRTAALAGSHSTGHAVAGGGVALAFNLGFGAGSDTLDEMISQVDKGVLVSDFWYTRVLDPKTMALTGLTRNGVWLIDKGEIITAVTNFRFTQSYPEALAPGQVLGVSREVIPQPSRWGMAAWRSPALRLASWNFTGGASG